MKLVISVDLRNSVLLRPTTYQDPQILNSFHVLFSYSSTMLSSVTACVLQVI